MLTACGTSGALPPPADLPALNPVIEVRQEIVRECPAALDAPIQDQLEPEAGAVVEYNAAGGRWLAATIARGDAGWAVVADARADCPDPAPEKAAP